MAKVSNEKKVIAVIVTYNRKELLKECIEAILNQNYKKCDVLVVDNNSTDGTYEYIKELLKNKRVIYKNTGANLGGAGGFNFGIKEAYELGCDFVWIMDDDCIVHKDTLQEFMTADKKLKGKYGFLASKVLWKDNNICEMNVQRGTLTKKVEDFDSELVPVVMSSFVSLFISTKKVKEFGLPIKEFFIWTDDWEYTRRISRKYDSYLVNNSIVTHKSNSNIGASIENDSLDRLNRYNYLYRNDVYLYKREGIKGWMYLIPRLCVHVFRILKSKSKGKFKKIKILICATIKGIKFNPEIEHVGKNVKFDKNDIKVSVVMPAYNAEKTIVKSIESVLNQTYSNVELVVVDDGSKDNTLKILKSIDDNRLKIISKQNEGPSIARNVGIKNSTGEYIVFLDADDKLERDIIEKSVKILNQKKYDVILFKVVYEKSGKIEDNCKFESFEFTKNDLKELNKAIFNKFEKYNNLFGFDGVPGKIINKKLILDNGIVYPENTFRFEDAIFCKKVYEVAKQIYFLAETGTYYVQTDGSICHKYNPKICDAIYTALEIFYGLTNEKQDFYIKCITSLSECENLYYLHKDNINSKKQLKLEFKQMINRSLYKETLESIDYNKIPLSYKIEVILLKKGFIGIYLFFKKIYFLSKKIRGIDK